MAETHELRLKINAAAARSGSREFVSSLLAIRTAVENLDRTTDGTFRRLGAVINAAANTTKKSNTEYDKHAAFIRKAQKAAREYVNATLRQEGVTLSASAALRRASEDTARLTERMRRVGDTRGINSLNAALLSLKANMASGVTSTAQLQRLMDAFSASSSRAKISLTQKEAAQRRAAESARALARQENDAATAARRVEREMRSIVGASSAASRAMRDATGSMRGLENAFSGTFQIGSAFRVMLGSITFGTFTQSVYQAGTTLEQFRVTMEVATGSAEAAAQEVAFIDDMARRLGTNLRGAREDFAKFAVSANLAGVNTATTRDIFESVAMAMSVMGRGAEDQRLAFLALEQMLSKNVVSSEELRRQLGERLPGAVNLMAKAVGVSTAELQKMLKAGALVSSEVLPKFAKEVRNAFGPGLQSATQRASFNIGTFRVEMEKLLEEVANSGFMDTIAQGMRDLTSFLRTDEATEAARKLGEGLAVLTRAVFRFAEAFVTNFDTVARIAKAVLAGVIVRQSLLMLNALALSTRGVLSLRDGFTALSGSATAAATGIGAVGTAASRLGVVMRGLGLIAGPIGFAVAAVSLLGTSFNNSTSEAERSATDYEDAMDRMRTSTFQFVDQARQKMSEDIFGTLSGNVDAAVVAMEEIERIQERIGRSATTQSAIASVALAPTRTETGADDLRSVADAAQNFIKFKGNIEDQKNALDKLKTAFERAYETAPEAFDQLKALSDQISEYARAVATAAKARGDAGGIIPIDFVDEAISAKAALREIRADIESTSGSIADKVFDMSTALNNAAGTGAKNLRPIATELENLSNNFTGTTSDIESLRSILARIDYSEFASGASLASELEAEISLLISAHDAESAALESATVRVGQNADAMAVAAGQTANATNEVYGLIAALNSIPNIQLNMANTLEGVMSGIRERVRLAQIRNRTELSVERALSTGPVAKAIEQMESNVREAQSKLEGVATSNPAYQGLVDQVTETQAQLERGITQIRSGLTEAEKAEKAQQEAFAAQRKKSKKGGGGGKGRTSALRDEKKALQNLQDDILKRTIALENEERVLRLLANGQTQYQESAELMAEAMRLNNGVLDESTRKRIEMLDAQQKLNEQMRKAAENPLQDWLDDVQTFDVMIKDVQATLAEGLSGVIQGVIRNGELDFTALLDSLSEKLSKFIADNLTKSLFENTGLGDIFGFGESAQGGSAAAQMQAAMAAGGAQAAAQMRAAMTGSAAPVATSIQAAHQTGAATQAAAIQAAGTTNATKTVAAGQSHAAVVGSTIQATGQQHAAAVGAATTGGSAGGGFFGFLGSLFGIPVGAEGFTTSGIRPTSFAAASPATFKNAPKFNAGTENTSGIPAILHPNEAVVPLTKGRKIPVDMGGAMGGMGSVYAPVFTFGDIVVTVENTDGENGQEQGEIIAEMIAVTIDNKINERLAENMQYGGMLRPRGS